MMASLAGPFGPYRRRGEADAAAAALRGAGLRRVGVVDLRPRSGIEADPVARWAMSRIWNETVRTTILSLPVLVLVNAILLTLTMPDQLGIAIGIGVAAGVGAAPVAAIVGFALAWGRWGYWTSEHNGSVPSAGFLVLTAGDPRRPRVE